MIFTILEVIIRIFQIGTIIGLIVLFLNAEPASVKKTVAKCKELKELNE